MLDKHYILMLLLSIAVVGLNAQSDDQNDGVLWTNVHLTKQLPKSFSTKIKLSYFDTNPLLSARFIDVGGLYQTKNKISIGLYYRFNGNLDLNPRRAYIEATHKNLNIKKLGIRVMPRFRVQYRGKINDCGKLESSFQFRPRIMIRKPLKNYKNTTFYTCVETFHETQTAIFVNFRRVRIDVGLRYKLPKNEALNNTFQHEMRTFFRHQSDFDQPELVMLNVINLGYAFTF